MLSAMGITSIEASQKAFPGNQQIQPFAKDRRFCSFIPGIPKPACRDTLLPSLISMNNTGIATNGEAALWEVLC
jgi:hypothetical protein